MNNYRKLSKIDKISRVGNVLHENICSFSSMGLSFRLIANIFEREIFDVRFEVAGTGWKRSHKVERGNQL